MVGHGHYICISRNKTFMMLPPIKFEKLHKSSWFHFPLQLFFEKSPF
jgi:hypothetical protein